MKKSEIVQLFGEPAAVLVADDHNLIFQYRDTPFCEKYPCTVVFFDDRVASFQGFYVGYTYLLEDGNGKSFWDQLRFW